MKSEYVKLVRSEMVYGEQNLLQTQLEFLNTLKNFKKFKDLRKEEFVLKVNLKSKIDETLAMFENFDKILPRTHYRLEPVFDRAVKEKKDKLNLTLQDEIDAVRKKIERLRIGL